MRISSKLKSSETVYQTDFSGGLNTSVDRENIEANELSAVENFDIVPGGKALRTRPGVVSMWESPAYPWGFETFFPVRHDGSVKFVTSAGSKLYLIDPEGASLEYDLNGTKAPTYALWGEQPLVMVASGATLQALDLSTRIPLLQNVGTRPEGTDPEEGPFLVGTVPNADIVFVWNGRVGVARAGTDRITFSGIGDHFNWQTEDIVPDDTTQPTDEWTEADAIWADIGWKTGGDILSVSVIGDSLAVLKSEGMAYAVTGYFPDWYFPEVSRNSATYSRFTCATGYGDLLFLDPKIGVCSFGDLKKYAASRPWEAGVKINDTIKGLCTSDGRVWFLSGRQQFVINPNGGKTVYVYTIGVGWTTWKFNCYVQGMADYLGTTYILGRFGTGDDAVTSIGRLSDSVATDFGEYQIVASVSGKAIVMRGTLSVFHTWVRHKALSSGAVSGSFKIGNDTIMSLRDVADGESASWQTWLGEPCTPKLISNGARIEVKGIGLEVGEI